MMASAYRLALTLALLISLCVGCSGKQQAQKNDKDGKPVANKNKQQNKAKDKDKDGKTATTQPQKSVTASLKTFDEINTEIAQHKGKIVVVDLWALW